VENNDLTSTLTSTGMKGGKQEQRIFLSEGEKMAAGCEKLDWKMEKAPFPFLYFAKLAAMIKW